MKRQATIAASRRRLAPRVWLALFASPFVLAAVFAVVVAYLVVVRGVPDDELVAAVERAAALPVSLGFALVFLMTRGLAAKDGVTLAALGWARPHVLDVVLGLGVALVLATLDAYWLHPLVQSFSPEFDPALSSVSLPAAITMMTIAVVGENTLYRGYALVVLEQRHGRLVAVAVTTVLYALLAPTPGFALKLWSLGFGVVLVVVRLWRGNLWPVVVAHLAVALAPKLVATLA